MSFPTLMIRLREATREIHARLEALPYPQALERRELPLESYVGHLRAMAVVHGVLEHELRAERDSRLGTVWLENMRRFSRIPKSAPAPLGRRRSGCLAGGPSPSGHIAEATARP